MRRTRIVLVIMIATAGTKDRCHGTDIVFEAAEGTKVFIRERPCTLEENVVEVALSGTFRFTDLRQTVQCFSAHIAEVHLSGLQEGITYSVSGAGSYGLRVWVFEEGISPTQNAGFTLNINDIQGIQFGAELGFAGAFPRIRHGLFGASEDVCSTLVLDIQPREADRPLFFRRADANGDGATDMADAVAILLYSFLNEEILCLDAGDTNDDGEVEVADALVVLEYLFLGGSRALPPSLYCGIDLTEDSLDCNGQPACMGER